MTTVRKICMTCVTTKHTTGVLVNAACTKDTNTNNLLFPNITILEDEDYELWIKETLTQYDADVTKAMVRETASLPKKTCKDCSRKMVKNECECDIRDTECYHCHLQSSHITPL